jgi:hypothetical protein
MSELSPLSGEERKLDFGADRDGHRFIRFNSPHEACHSEKR